MVVDAVVVVLDGRRTKAGVVVVVVDTAGEDAGGSTLFASSNLNYTKQE